MNNANVEFFANAHNVGIGGHANINVTNNLGGQAVAGGGTPKDILNFYAASGCLYNALERYDPPKCAPETREKILKAIEKWVLEDKHGAAALMWLFGAAGAGKSAIAQTTVENCILKGLHAASCFFSRTGDTKRSESRRLVATITLQILGNFPNARPRIEKVIRDNPHLFATSIKNQMEQLLGRPLKSKWYRRLFQIFRPPRARLVVIDGLDECKNPEQQKEILRMLAETIPLLPYPFRFLVVSRPEAHIMEVFRGDLFKNVRYDEMDLGLDADADKSIENYLRQCFEKIRSTHRLVKDDLDPDWPSDDAVANIVAKASGQFIYASTVIKYVEYSKSRPDKRLKVILGLEMRPVKDDPFAQLNLLYMLIFDTASSKEKWQELLQSLFGILYLSTLPQHKYLVPSPRKLEFYLCLEKNELLPVLDDFLSLLQVFDEDLERPIKIYHASLFDFLLDKDRSQSYHLDLGMAHRRLAEFFLPPTVLTTPDEVLYLTFLYHAERAALSPVLEDYLQDLPFLYRLDPDNSIYWGYAPFIYYTYLSTLARPGFHNGSSKETRYSYHLKKIEQLLADKSPPPLGVVLPKLLDVDLTDSKSNDIHQLFTKFVNWLMTDKDLSAPLQAICNLASGSLKDWDLTTLTLKHILLAALPICQPTTSLYEHYAIFARYIIEGVPHTELDKAIRIRLEAFLELPIPRGSEKHRQDCRTAWSPMLQNATAALT